MTIKLSILYLWDFLKLDLNFAGVLFLSWAVLCGSPALEEGSSLWGKVPFVLVGIVQRPRGSPEPLF
jgi:hypothetical protein